MLAMLIGYGLRLAELLGLTMQSIQLREEHWVIADLVGKGGHIRRVPIPVWAKKVVDVWTGAATRPTFGRVAVWAYTLRGRDSRAFAAERAPQIYT
jgi:site-specific recombinase XerC